MDKQSRVWVAARIRPNQTAAFCREGSSHPSAQAFPLAQSGRQMQMYDPKTKQVTTIDTCFGTHHLNFDGNDTLWFTGGGPVEGWFNTRIWDETKDEQKAVGWCGQVVDTNGDGKITAPPWNQITGRGESLLYAGDTTGGSGLTPRAGGPGASGAGGGPDPKLDTLVSFSLYGVIPSPVDDSVWGVAERFPGYLVRVDRGKNPPQSCMAEIYKVPEPGFDFVSRGAAGNARDQRAPTQPLVRTGKIDCLAARRAPEMLHPVDRVEPYSIGPVVRIQRRIHADGKQIVVTHRTTRPDQETAGHRSAGPGSAPPH